MLGGGGGGGEGHETATLPIIRSVRQAGVGGILGALAIPSPDTTATMGMHPVVQIGGRQAGALHPAYLGLRRQDP